MTVPSKRRRYLRCGPGGDIRFAHQGLTPVEPGQRRVTVALSGICSTDEIIVRARAEGRDLPPTLRAAHGCESLGHEIVGWAEDAVAGGACVMIPAERKGPGRYACLGLTAGSHGGWATTVTAEDWAIIAVDRPDPRYVLVDAFAAGFGLAHVSADPARRTVVLGLGALGVGLVLALEATRNGEVVGVDTNPLRVKQLSGLVDGPWRGSVGLTARDRVVLALPTDALDRELVTKLCRQVDDVWSLTHPRWPRDHAGHDVRWIHDPPADHRGAAEYLRRRPAFDSMVDVVDWNQVATSGRLPARSGLRAALRVADR